MSLEKKDSVAATTVNRVEVTPVSRVTECDDNFVLTIELPGTSEQDVELVLENQSLSLSAESVLGNYPDHSLVLNEIPEVRYRTSFDLPKRVDVGKIRAAHKNGLLILTLPKREEVKPRRIDITAG